MEWTVLPHPAHSLSLAPSDYHLFGPVKDALCGSNFADAKELKQNFRDVLRSQGREFCSTGIQPLTQRCQMCVENGGDFAEKYLHNCKRYVNLIVTVITFSVENWTDYFPTAPRTVI
jgi:hypothetical protein